MWSLGHSFILTEEGKKQGRMLRKEVQRDKKESSFAPTLYHFFFESNLTHYHFVSLGPTGFYQRPDINTEQFFEDLE